MSFAASLLSHSPVEGAAEPPPSLLDSLRNCSTIASGEKFSSACSKVVGSEHLPIRPTSFVSWALYPASPFGAVQAGADHRPALWGLLDALDRQEIRIQTFMHRSCLACMDGTSTITGVAPRHLDSWLMSPDVCRQAFVRGSRHCDLAVVEGNLSGAESLLPGGHIEPLCDWLGLPRIGILNVRGLSGCRLPGKDLPLDAVLLDGVANASDFYRWQTTVETLCGLPVLGALEETPIAREIISRLQPGQKPARELCRALGDQMARYLQTGAVASGRGA